ncbi:MAG TPA: protein kinase [Kofleriaceae bacterium]|nr:protein kinase [Kofleriaceae bacterium]
MAVHARKSIGRYELVIELARGGMAELFLGRLHGAGGFTKLVAIKRILPQLAQDAQFKDMFLYEGRLAARLAHPNVCQVFELAEDAGELYLAMEYLDGVSWDQLLAAATAHDDRATILALTAGVIAQAAEGLHYAHALRDPDGRATPIVHRDVSPQNLFVTVDGICKVLDFGVAKMMTDGPRTRSGVIKGKLPYMAPEQIRGEPVDPRADVFSLGVCAWEALAGERLYDRATDFLIWKAIMEEDVPAIASRWPQCPPAIDAVIRRALDREPGHRPESVRAFAAELARHAPVAHPEQLGAAVRALCADRLARRASQVASALAAPDDVAPDASAAQTIAVPPARDAAETVDMHVRAKSMVVRRADSEPPPARSRVGLVVGACAGLAVIAAVAIAATRGGHDAAAPIAAAPAAPDAREAAPTPASAVTPPDAAVDAAASVEPKLAKAKPRPKPAPSVTSEPGFLSIDSTPYATIYVDGKRLGDTALYREAVPAGTHQVRAVLADGRERRFTVKIVGGQLHNAGKLTW